MKWIINVTASIFLLSGLAACNQENASHDTKVSSPDVAVAPKNQNPKNSTTASTTPKDQGGLKGNAGQVPVTLVETVDGDTIKVNYNGKVETVRYLLVDTPEEKKPNTCVQPYSMEAANRNNQLLNSGKLTLEFEHGSQRDKYGRLLAYVFVNGSSVEETLLKEGYARVAYIYEPPYKYLSQFEADESVAKGQHLHIWAKAGYATDRGFVGCVNTSSVKPAVSPVAAAATKTLAAPAPKAAITPKAASTTAAAGTPVTTAGNGATEYFANCTELRKKYPNGVPEGHPAYQERLDRDKDGFACEKN